MKPGSLVKWYLGPSVVEGIDQGAYQLREKASGLTSKATEETLQEAQTVKIPKECFSRRVPALCMVDEFYKDPALVRKLALEQDYIQTRHMKRTAVRFLFPNLQEQFERILGVPLDVWLKYPENGCFQLTTSKDTQVPHSGRQTYAAAICLGPSSGNTPQSSPTGPQLRFWQDRSGCRRPPYHPLEKTTETRQEVQANLCSMEYTSDMTNWTCVDTVSLIPNRLVIWDAQCFHSIKSAVEGQLLQLFYFDLTV